MQTQGMLHRITDAAYRPMGKIAGLPIGLTGNGFGQMDAFRGIPGT